MSLPRATFFVLNAAGLNGFEMTWTSPGAMNAAHGGLWLIVTLWSALLSIAIATGAFARVSGRDWGWGRTLSVSAIFLAILVLAGLAAGIAAGQPIRAAGWNGLAMASASGLLTDAPGVSAPLLWLAAFPISALAMLGPFVLLDTFTNSRPPSAVSRLTWAAVAPGFLLAVLLVVAMQALAGSDLLTGAALRDLTTAGAVAIDARGAGFVDATASLSPAARWALVPVLLVGGASGGVGGGIRAVTLAVVFLGLLRLLRGRAAGRTFAMATLWLLAMVVLFGLTFLLLVQFSPQLRPDRVAILAAAALGGAGVSVDPLTAAGADAYVMAGAMLLGRVLPWLVLWWSAARGDEPVAVG